jgi:protein-L-isoaspartate(D-aspartate) O-methyltransferase
VSGDEGEVKMGMGERAAAAGDGRRARALRREMAAALRAGGEIRTPAVSAAFAAVPRHLFVPEVSTALAYADVVVPTKFDRAGGAISALSQPAIVAVMLEQLDVRPGMRVLEVGAGTGYNAALLGRLVGAGDAGDDEDAGGSTEGGDGRVVTVDVDEDLVEGATRHLADAVAATGCSANVEVVLGDGAFGHAAGAPYDRIIASVAAADLPPAWLRQLAPDGKLVLPLRIRGAVTRSLVVEREPDRASDDIRWLGSRLEVCSFMPLRGIADDPARYVELTEDGSAGVNVYAEQQVGEQLGRALEYEGDEQFTGVSFDSAESFSDLDLFLTCALPGGMTRLSATGRALESGLVRPQFNWGAMCAVDGDSLAYLTLRRTGEDGADRPESDDDPARRWEVGVIGHGPQGAELAAAVAALIGEWDHERLRDARAVLRFAQGDGRERLTGRCVVDKKATRIAVDWEQQ